MCLCRRRRRRHRRPLVCSSPHVLSACHRMSPCHPQCASDLPCSDAADKPNLAAQPAEGSTAELTDSFCASGDTTGDITVDSVKVHMR